MFAVENIWKGTENQRKLGKWIRITSGTFSHNKYLFFSKLWNFIFRRDFAPCLCDWNQQFSSSLSVRTSEARRQSKIYFFFKFYPSSKSFFQRPIRPSGNFEENRPDPQGIIRRRTFQSYSGFSIFDFNLKKNRYFQINKGRALISRLLKVAAPKDQVFEFLKEKATFGNSRPEPSLPCFQWRRMSGKELWRFDDLP